MIHAARPGARWSYALALALLHLASCPASVAAGATEAEAPPEIVAIHASDTALLTIVIEAGRVNRPGQVEYIAEAGDTVVPDEDRIRWVWKDGKIVQDPKGFDVMRAGAKLGTLSGDGHRIVLREKFAGVPLDPTFLLRPESYAISSQEDPAYQRPRAPLAVSRKAKPIDRPIDAEHAALRHSIYLQLPEPLREGANYEVVLTGINTRQTRCAYRHDTYHVVSGALHVSAIGFRPDDPFKTGSLSAWLGTSGGHVYPDIPSFEIVDASTGQLVWSGKDGRSWRAPKDPAGAPARRSTCTDVVTFDFSAFRQPGHWRLRVPGIGVSPAFRISDQAWAAAFQVSMLGFLHHRASIELGPPLTEFRRPRNFHPDDGVKIFQIDVTTLDGESGAVSDAIGRMVASGRSWPVVPEAWGGYHDAGDWDRRSQHLSATLLHLELLDLFPDYFATLRLRLPANEADNQLPDLLDEALWNLDFYRRLQLPDGGVRGGVESTAHPRDGELSWQESLVVGCFAPDAVSSHRFAAAAARASRVLARHDSKLAAEYADAARRAFAWAEQHRTEKTPGGKSQDRSEIRALAAVELYRLTRLSAYHDVFKSCGLPSDKRSAATLQDASFAYALLPEDLADPGVQAAAREHIRMLAESALSVGADNPYGLTSDSPDMPARPYGGYFSVPGVLSQSLPRAHFLSGDARYLMGALRATQFSAGANPENLCYTTGLGERSPQAPLHIDHRRSGQPPPVGITVYGGVDLRVERFVPEWVSRYHLAPHLVPTAQNWPATESHIDMYSWAAVNEYTIHQTLGTTSYYWGYLAARSTR